MSGEGATGPFTGSRTHEGYVSNDSVCSGDMSANSKILTVAVIMSVVHRHFTQIWYKDRSDTFMYAWENILFEQVNNLI